MEIFIKTAVLTLIVAILGVITEKTGKDITFLLILSAICMIAGTIISFIEPIFAFIDQLISVANLNADMLQILIKAVGIGILTEITVLVCINAGNSSAGKALQMLSVAVTVWLSLPLFTSLIELVEEVLICV